jgi:hypothetical protein
VIDPSRCDPHLAALADAARAAAAAERRLREAVASARGEAYSWTVIGDILDLSRQAARQRYGAADRLIQAWANVEHWAGVVARKHNWDAAVGAVEVLKQLRREDLLGEWQFDRATELYDLRNRAVQQRNGITPGEITAALEFGAIVSGALMNLAVPRAS